MNRFSALIVGLALLASTQLAFTQTKGQVTFGGLKNLEFINDYYDGGQGSLGSGPGKDFPLQFTSNAQAIVQANKGGSGNFINNPGNYPVMFFQSGNNVIVNAPNGISAAIWFSYSAVQSGTATIYSGANGTGTILFSSTLNPNNSGCTGYKLCVWTPVGVALNAAAFSIRFSAPSNSIAIGTIHIGQNMPTAVALSSSQNPSTQGQPVTFTAVVTSTAGALPIGTVTFKSANKVLATVPTVSGAAAVTISTLPTGSSTISAIFKGAGFVSTTAKITQVVD